MYVICSSVLFFAMSKYFMIKKNEEHKTQNLRKWAKQLVNARDRAHHEGRGKHAAGWLVPPWAGWRIQQGEWSTHSSSDFGVWLIGQWPVRALGWWERLVSHHKAQTPARSHELFEVLSRPIPAIGNLTSHYLNYDAYLLTTHYVTKKVEKQ